MQRVPGPIAVVVLTHNRLGLLERCVERVLAHTSAHTTEILIWDNASNDGTAEFVESLADPRIAIVRNERNVGQSAYDAAFRLTTAPYIVELDDDVVEAPPGWDRTLRDAFVRLPDVGFLAANLVDEPRDATARIMYGENAHLYRVVESNGVRLKVGGPIGGGCTMTSRAIFDAVRGFGRQRRTFWYEDAVFIQKLARRGLGAAYLEDLRVLHTGGPAFTEVTPEKVRFWEAQARRARRRARVKRALLHVPFVRPLNARHGWFEPPTSAGS